MADVTVTHELAQDAMHEGNFDLAVDICEQVINQDVNNFKTYLLRGDAYAKAGHLKEATDAYSTVFRWDNVKPDHFHHFIGALLETMRKKKDFIPNRQAAISDAHNDYFTCFVCLGLLHEPATIPCGHTFCRKCVAKDVTNTCKTCGVRHLSAPMLSVNVSLQSLIEKLFPSEIQSLAKKEEGNKAYSRGKLEEAINLYTEALRLSPGDHIVLSNRSNVFFKMKHFREAEVDGENTIRLRPDWSKGYFRTAQAQAGQGKLEYAAASYLQCLVIDESREVKAHLAKVIHTLLNPLSNWNQATKHIEGDCGIHAALIRGIATRSKHSGNTPSKCGEGSDGKQESSTAHKSPLGELPFIQEEKIMRCNSLPQIMQAHFCSETSGRRKRQHSEVKTPESSESPESTSQTPTPKMPMTADYTPTATIPRNNSFPNIRQTSYVQKEAGEADVAGAEDAACAEDATYNSLADFSGKSSIAARQCLPCRLLKKAASAGAAVKLSSKRKRFPIDRLDREDFECSLCLRLLWEPVTTTCGHMFCRSCLNRVKDHSTRCPLCKNDLSEHLSQRAMTDVFERLIKDFLPQEFEERKQIHEDEVAEIARAGTAQDSWVPIFVCMLAFPTITCPLHIFEPRYRLMVRQAMETGSRQFGMCLGLSNQPADFAEFGTMLEIQDVSYFDDGRAVVNSVGGRRFRVLERGMRDGYNTAKVEYIRDLPETDPAAVASLVALESRTYDVARHWFTSLPASKQQRIESHFGAFPGRVVGDIQSQLHGPKWIWWKIAVLPVDHRIQLRVLGSTSLRERLLTVQSLLLHFNHTMGIGPLPHGDPRNLELNELRVSNLQGNGEVPIVEEHEQLPEQEQQQQRRDPNSD